VYIVMDLRVPQNLLSDYKLCKESSALWISYFVSFHEMQTMQRTFQIKVTDLNLVYCLN
jgi:hypothetical protein